MDTQIYTRFGFSYGWYYNTDQTTEYLSPPKSREFSIYHVSFKKILSKISLYDEYVNAVQFDIGL